MEIPIPKSKETDIYDLGFDKTLNRETNTDATNTVYNALDQTNPGQLSSGGLTGDLVMADGEMKSQNYTAGSAGWMINADGTAEFRNIIIGSSMIVGSSLDTTTLARLFTTSTAKIDVEAWRHVSDMTLIDGGDIYTDSVTADKINVDSLSALNANMGTLTAGNITINNAGYVKGGQTGFNASVGFFIGYSGDAYKLSIGNPSADYMKWDGSAIVVSGRGVFNLTSGTVVVAALNGVIGQGNLNVANRGWSQTCAFSPGSSLYVKWLAGSFITADGTAYNIGAGSTGVMGARHYVFLDTAVATNVYQTTTVAANGVGAGRVLLATAINATTEAAFYVFGGSGGASILGEDITLNSLTGSAIVANSITGNEIAADAITASKIDVGYLSAIAADMGTLTTGNITLDSASNIKGGQTAYNTGSGFFLGYDTSAYKQSIGDGTENNSLLWDGTDMYVKGSKMLMSLFYGDGSDGAVVINADTTLTADMFYSTLTINATKTLRPAGYRIFCKNLLTNSGTISANGKDASGLIAGAGWSGNYLRDATSGGNGSGGNSNGNNGTGIDPTLGGAGGDGGDTTSFTGGNGGTAADPSAISGGFRALPRCIELYSYASGGTLKGAAGGGGGANDTDGAGGGGGGGAGSLIISSKKIVNYGVIQANGGNGAAGVHATNKCGGGGGGGGGMIVLVYNSYTGAGTKTATGGTAGSGVNGGGNGVAGSDGTVLDFLI